MQKLFRQLFPTKEQRAYNKMHRRHRKELIKHAKVIREWDSSWSHDSILMQIRHMHEYYSNDNIVWQSDETRKPIIEQLQHILDLEAEIKEIDRMRNDKCGIECKFDNGVYTVTFPDDYKERIDKWDKREQELYEELYSLIGKHLRYWWD